MQVDDFYFIFNFKLMKAFKIFVYSLIMHIIIRIYRKFYVQKIWNIVLNNQFQIFCIQITTNLIEALMISYLYL